MAWSATTVMEIRASATAGNVNGGGFNPSNGAANATDYSQQDAAQYGFTDLASTDGTTNPSTVTSASHTFDSNDVGNFLKVNSGTNWTVGWYEIVSVAGGAATLDRAVGTAATLSNGTYKVGGAISLGGTGTSSDDAFFENAVAGNKFYIKNGSYTLGVQVTLTATGGTQKPIVIEGYNSSRGDHPVGANRPTLDAGAVPFTTAANWDIYNIIFTGTASTAVLVPGANSKHVNLKVSNTSGTAGRFGATINAADLFFSRCEFVSTAGSGVRVIANANFSIIGCYFHDSDMGLAYNTGATSSGHVINCIFDTCATNAVHINTANTAANHFYGNTFYGAETPAGTGINMITGVTDVRLLNNIFYGFTTAVSHADTQSVGHDNFNNYYNNTTDCTNWTKGPNTIALNPNFTNGAGGDFSVGTNMKAVGMPALFPGGLSTGYVDIGAVQRKEKVSTDPGEANVKTGVGYTFEDASKTGTYDGSDRWTDPGVTNVRLSTAYKANSTTNNRTGTVRVPAVGNVKTGYAYDASDSLTGTYDGSDRWTDPGEANVALGVAYKANSLTNNKTGTLEAATVDDIWNDQRALTVAKFLGLK